ncbi:hypothetical protein ACFWIA_23480, partial [Streptomyces sp. NPDC127068]
RQAQADFRLGHHTLSLRKPERTRQSHQHQHPSGRKGADNTALVMKTTSKNGGGPFTAWATVFERTSDRIRARFEPRFPHVWPHRCRHTFSMRTLEYLVSGHYRQAAKLVRDTDADAAMVFYLSKADPLLVLRDLLGHSTVLTTEKYLSYPDQIEWFKSQLDARRQAGTTAKDTTKREDDLARLRRENTDLRKQLRIYAEAMRQLTMDKAALEEQVQSLAGITSLDERRRRQAAESVDPVTGPFTS